MSANKKANTAFLLGCVTALVGLLQVMWTTPPWWHKDNAPVATVSSAGDATTEVEHPVMEQSTPPKEWSTWGYYVAALGIIAAMLALGYRLIDRLSHVDVGDGPFHPVL